jgi:hypothetical protein
MEIHYESLNPVPAEVAPGLLMNIPGTATLTDVESAGSLLTVVMDLRMTADGVRATSIKVTASKPGEPVTSAALRLPVAELIREVLRIAILPGRTERHADGSAVIEVGAPVGINAELIRLRGPGNPESLATAARIYTIARLTGLPPVRQVSAELGMPRTTATTWIRRAREAGLLPAYEEEGQ